MSWHEIIHETKKRKEVGVILKLDFEKAYGKVNWKFLFDYMQMRGFNDKWRNQIAQVVTGGTVSIKVNEKTGTYIKAPFAGLKLG